MTRIILQRSGNADLFPTAVQSIYRDGQRIWNPSYSLAKDAECWEKAWQDEIASGAIERRLFGVCGDWELAPASDDEADILLASVMEEVLREGLHKFPESRFNLGRSAFLGMAWADVTGGFQRKRVHDNRERRWWIPGELRDVDYRMFHQVAILDRARDVYRVSWRRYSPARHRWEKLDPTKPMVRMTRFDRQSSLGYGTGILDSIYKVLYIRGEIQRLGLLGVRRWAAGLLHGKVDANAVGGATETSEDARDQLRDDLKKMLEDHVLVTDSKDDVSVITGGAEGHQIVGDWLDRVAKDLIVRIEGAYLPSGGGGEGGAYALGKEQREVQLSSRDIDQMSLEEAITGQDGTPSRMGLLRFAVHMNRATLGDIDRRLLTARCPKFKLKRQRIRDPEERVKTAGEVARLGGRISLKYLHDVTEFPMAEEGEEIVQAPAEGFGMDGLGGGLGSGGSRLGSLLRDIPGMPGVSAPDPMRSIRQQLSKDGGGVAVEEDEA